jgi:hypothetical protein
VSILFKTGASLTVALILAGGEQGAAQQQPPPTPPAQSQPPAQTRPQAVTPPAPQAGQPAEPATQPQRPSKRTPRTSRRQPASAGQGSFEEARTPRDGGPTRQELTFVANVLGGYDDNVTGGLGTGSGSAPTAMASGATAFLGGTLDYFRGNGRHSIAMDATGNLTAYPGYLDDPAAGGAATVGARTTLGRDTTFRVSQRVGYEPLFSVYSSSADSTPLPPDVGQAVTAAGLFERRSLNSRSSLSIDQRWSRRDWTSLSYSYGVQQFTEDAYGDNWSHNVSTSYRRGLAPGVRARAEYRYRNLEYTESDSTAQRTRQHRIEGGAEVERVRSRRRYITFSLAAGAGYVEAVGSADGQPYQSWVPTGSAGVNVAPSPDWNIDAGYRRDFSLFQGVTDDVYATDTAFLSTSWLVSARINLSVGATYSNWDTFVASGVRETLNVYGARLQFQVRITDSVAANAGYYYYDHRYSNPGALPAGFPAEYDRHAFRVGLTVWVPLAGTSSRPRLTQR